ncbi:hypothetical protein PGH07_04135 [Sulfurovum sp. zt1-1]|uniref:Uncharacterized protein n=1 Tax=Sulfurovum zhangzhouensis TaxID=3019067 RepID=A0ABT7QX41_9BACT|nr:hypothetical protein [Sulfurovum zhangzhouensis]MDM5271357.1 hypothetical protein [Sulfurovum zhangzhouensis]
MKQIKEFEKKSYRQPQLKIIGTIHNNTKNQNTITTVTDNGSTQNPRYSLTPAAS